MRELKHIASLALVAAASLAGASELPPNVVLLIGDDHGYPYFGFMGDRNVHTPAMDALAAGGYTFTLGHVTAPYCRPSLRSTITGMHPVQYVLRENRIVERQRRAHPGYAALDEREQRKWNVALARRTGGRLRRADQRSSHSWISLGRMRSRASGNMP